MPSLSRNAPSPPGSDWRPPRVVRPALATLLALILSLASFVAVPALADTATAPPAGVAVPPQPDGHVPPEPATPVDLSTIGDQLATLINGLRAEYGLAPLVTDPVLDQVALSRSEDMVQRRYFSHEIPGVGFAPLWLRDHVVKGATGIGENLGLSDEPDDHVVQALFDAWTTSPTHLENLIRPEFTRVGTGLAELPADGARPALKIVTQEFAIANGPVGLTRG